MSKKMAFASRRFSTEREAAIFLNMSVKTLQRWRWLGEGPAFYKFGKAVRYAMTDLEAFITSSRRNSTTDKGEI